jgi:hypothetical protein
MIIRGSKTGVFSVYFVVIDAITPKTMPMSTPPIDTTRNEVAPRTISIGRMLASPMSDSPSKSLYRTTETASLSSDSPNTTMYNMSFTLISTKMAKTATGSTAEMSAANTKQCNMSNSTPPYTGVKEKPQMVRPMQNVLKSVLAMANSKIVPRLSKNGL